MAELHPRPSGTYALTPAWLGAKCSLNLRNMLALGAIILATQDNCCLAGVHGDHSMSRPIFGFASDFLRCAEARKQNAQLLTPEC